MNIKRTLKFSEMVDKTNWVSMPHNYQPTSALLC